VSHICAIDTSYNSFTGGYFAGAVRRRDLRVVKLDNTGAFVWAYEKAAPAPGADPDISEYEPQWLSVAPDGRIHVSALYDDFGKVEIDINADGTENWTDINTGTRGYSLCVHDDSGNVIVGGGTQLRQYDSAGGVDFDHTFGNFPDLSGRDNSHMEWFNGFLFVINRVNTTTLEVKRFSGADFSTEDWLHTVTVSAPTSLIAAGEPRITVDSAGDVYITYNATVSGVQAGLWKKLDGSDGSEIFASSIASTRAIFPLVPPGRPPLFI
jgi:hypothetical protein